jgi:hypothetical protein
MTTVSNRPLLSTFAHHSTKHILYHKAELAGPHVLVHTQTQAPFGVIMLSLPHMKHSAITYPVPVNSHTLASTHLI